MNTTDKMAEMLKQLRAEYLASIPAKIAEIRREIERGDVAGIRESFHKLKGTGKTYGLPEVSELAAVVERVCLQAPEHGTRAGELGLELLDAVYAAHRAGGGYPLERDPAFLAVQKLLPA